MARSAKHNDGGIVLAANTSLDLPTKVVVGAISIEERLASDKSYHTAQHIKTGNESYQGLFSKELPY